MPCPPACLGAERLACPVPNPRELHPRKLDNDLTQTLGQGSSPGGYVRSVNRQCVQYQENLHASKGPAFPMPFDISSEAFIDRMVHMAQSGARVFRRCLTHRPWLSLCADHHHSSLMCTLRQINHILHSLLWKFLDVRHCFPALLLVVEHGHSWHGTEVLATRAQKGLKGLGGEASWKSSEKNVEGPVSWLSAFCQTC